MTAAPPTSPDGIRAEAASALLASNRRRRRVRRWIAIGTLPLTLAALLFVGKVLSMYAFAHQSIRAYVVDDFAGAESAARGQDPLNVIEPYKAPFNLGTSLAGAERLPEARTELERALDLATGLEVCSVRINLALVVERMGDAARSDGDGAAAATLYGDALDITTGMPPECDGEDARQQSSDPNRDMQESKDGLEGRLLQKQQGEQPQEQPEQPPQEQPSGGALDDLKDKLEQGTRERDQQQGDDGGVPGTERPW